MSRAGRASGPHAKRREVQERVAAAAAAHAAPAVASELPPEAHLAFRAQQLHIRCKAAIVSRYPSLWPGESIGAAIAEQWMQNLMRRMQEDAAQMQARATEAGIVLPA